MKIINIATSYYFGPEVFVIYTECGHHHLRFRTERILSLKIGDNFKCYCEDDNATKKN